MEIKQILPNGDSPKVRTTVTVDNVCQSFTVEIRSLTGVHPDAIKRQLQKMWEVFEVEEISRTDIVRQGNEDIFDAPLLLN